MDVEEIEHAYAHGEDRPLGGYVAVGAGYLALAVGTAVAARARGAKAPESFGWQQLVLMTVATGRFSRIIAKDPITSPLRAPFTRYQGRSGEAELAEEVRGHGVQHAAGELITCPFCMSQWVATVFAAGTVLAPGPTRLAALTGTLVAGSDLFQFGYAAIQRLWKRGQ